MSRLAINAHEIGRVLSGRQTFFLRPAMSSFLNVRPGHALWLAEPFHLETRFDHLAPTAARDRGAVPSFAADRPDHHPGPAYGKRHPARSLCRDWHRFHVIITAREQLPVTDVTAADLRVLGFDNRMAFEDYWNQEAMLSRYRTGVRDEQLLRFAFTLVPGRLPANADLPQLQHLTWAHKRELAAAAKPAPAGDPPIGAAA
jgi:hypothetical protein